MSIRPVDMAIVYTKTSEADKIQQNEQQQGRIAQHAVTSEEIKVRDVATSQVQKSTKEEDANKVTREKERQNARKHRGDDGQPQEDDDQTETAGQDNKAGGIYAGGFDITV